MGCCELGHAAQQAQLESCGFCDHTKNATSPNPNPSGASRAKGGVVLPSTVLCVDEDRGLTQIVSEALRGAGYHALQAHDGEEALRVVQTQRPQLMLIDLMLPKRDGFEVIQEIRRLPGDLARMPIVITAAGLMTPQYVSRAKELGVQVLLTKPVSLKQLVETVSHNIASTPHAATKSGTADEVSAKRISGDLAHLSFPALLHHLHGMRATGVLFVQHGQKRKGIQFKDGYPVAIKSNQVSECLGNYLVRIGKISETHFRESIERLKTKQGMQGEILVAMQALTEDELARALQEQADEKIYEIFSWVEGKYRFDVGEQLERANTISMTISPANMVLRGVSQFFPIERVDRVLRKNADLYLIDGESPFYRFQEVDLTPEQRALLQEIDGTRRVGDYLQRGESVRRFLYAMLTVGLFELDAEGGESIPRASVSEATHGEVEQAAARVRPAPAAADSREDAQEEVIRHELAAHAERFETCDDFAVLGVKVESTDDEIRSAYVRLAKQVHPDRFSNASEPLRKLADKVFARVAMAFENIGTLQARAEYFTQLRRAAEEAKAQAEAHRMLQAENWFQKGEGYLKVKSYDKAIEAFGMACHTYPQEGEYLSHLGYALFLRNPTDGVIRQEALQHLAKGIKLAPDREKSYLFLGRIYKAADDLEMARKMFTRAVQVKADCHEALQELRLLNLREEKGKSLIKKILRR